MNFENFYILNEANIYNINDLKITINNMLQNKGIVTGPIYDWFHTQFIKWVQRQEPFDREESFGHPDVYFRHHVYKEGEPEWAKKDDIVEFVNFSPARIQHLNHIIDYFLQLPGIDFHKIHKEPYEVINQKVAEWNEHLKNQMQQQQLKERLDYTTIQTLENGYKIIELLSKKAYQDEGNQMGHCIASYFERKMLGASPSRIISLRDSKMEPHVTIELRYGKIIQIQGKQNRRPENKYIVMLTDFILSLLGIDLNTGSKTPLEILKALKTLPRDGFTTYALRTSIIETEYPNPVKIPIEFRKPAWNIPEYINAIPFDFKDAENVLTPLTYKYVNAISKKFKILWNKIYVEATKDNINSLWDYYIIGKSPKGSTIVYAARASAFQQPTWVYGPTGRIVNSVLLGTYDKGECNNATSRDAKKHWKKLPESISFQDYFLTEANIFNKELLISDVREQISNYLYDQDGLSPETVTTILNWFLTQYVRWYCSSEDDTEKNFSYHEYQEGQPEWAKKSDVVDFEFFDEFDKEHFHHIMDYFIQLPEIDLNKIHKETYPVIKQKVADWDEHLKKKMQNSQERLIEGTDFHTILPFPDSYKWIILKSQKAYTQEGESMGHCVAGYFDKPVLIFSLRDEKMQPHVTMEVKNVDSILQIQGKENNLPEPKYWKYLAYIITKNNLHIQTSSLVQRGLEIMYKLNTEQKTYFRTFINKTTGIDKRVIKNPNNENEFAVIFSNKRKEHYLRLFDKDFKVKSFKVYKMFDKNYVTKLSDGFYLFNCVTWKFEKLKYDTGYGTLESRELTIQNLKKLSPVQLYQKIKKSYDNRLTAQVLVSELYPTPVNIKTGNSKPLNNIFAIPIPYSDVWALQKSTRDSLKKISETHNVIWNTIYAQPSIKSRFAKPNGVQWNYYIVGTTAKGSTIVYRRPGDAYSGYTYVYGPKGKVLNTHLTRDVIRTDNWNAPTRAKTKTLPENFNHYFFKHQAPTLIS